MIDELLLCPHCKHEYTHHDRVTVYARVEDAQSERHVIEIPDGETTRPMQIPDNPSDRRSGLVVEGYCESCSGRWQLIIAQDKGNTLVKMSKS